ncbi:competence protein CoiA family protein [Caproiciproducens faecalis]|uniref:Competence protein CoiA-like family protein n=1 Tax=Caproiciproducens faecalis TaxID=2820301 RepID=A0ABS7DMF9_9FIRM|nr:competence protein CoiA family protein [Caproiciproducens faecalis]MBW7572494.1 hypothetical protein [Caproiciproducens faecalis]
MYVCKYGNHSLFVDTEAPETFDLLKKLSNEHKLFCLGCGRQVIFHKCTVKDSHFAHRSSQGKLCDFEQYIINLPDSHKKALKELQNRFSGSNNPQLFIKLIDKHWTSMTICVNDKTVAIELLQPNISLNKIEKLKQAYIEKGINVLWIFVMEDISCEYKSVSIKGSNSFFQTNNYIIDFDPESKKIYILFKDHKFSTNHNGIFHTSISLDHLIVNAEGKISESIKTQYDDWKSQQSLQAKLKQQLSIAQSAYNTSTNVSSSNASLDLTYDEILHNVRQWIENVRAGAGYNTLTAIRTLINNYSDYRQVYSETLQSVEDPVLKKKLESVLR